MKIIHTVLSLVTALGCSSLHAKTHWQAGMKEGKPEIKSISQLAFGPEGILFIADSKSAAVVAIATGDIKPAAREESLRIDAIDLKVAGLLGTTPDQLLITDLVVNPVSVRVKARGELEVVNLDQVKFSRGILPDAPVDGVVGEGNRKSNPRQESITDIAFLQDRVLIAGLSNEEFASTLRAIPFPFETVANGTTVEIFHGAHGKFETRSPVRTFVPFNIGNQPSLIAAYTCTPLVQFPIGDLKPGSKIKGKTIAELGNRNRPIDMIVYQKDGKDFLLLANSSRGIMKISTENIEKAESITSPVADKQGQSYETVTAWTGVDQLDKLDPGHALVVRRGDGKTLNLESLPLP